MLTLRLKIKLFLLRIRERFQILFHSETFLIGTICLLFLFSFSKILITKKAILTHDTIDWYGIYQFFIESIYNGFWPLWNPYTHAGEPFYYNYAQVPLLEPIFLISVSIGSFFRIDVLTLYHWGFFLQLLFMYLGMYLLLRRFYTHLFTKIILFIIIILSSISLISMRLLGVLQVLYYTPWILYAIFRIFENRNGNIFNWILLSTFLGLSFCQYGVVYVLSFIFIFLTTFLIKGKIFLFYLVSIFSKKNYKLLFCCLLIFMILSSPLWTIVFFDSHNIYPVVRAMDGTSNKIFLSLNDIKIGELHRGATMFSDLLTLINPLYNYKVYALIFAGVPPNPDPSLINKSANVSESFLYIGFLPLFLAVYGVLFSRNKYKLNFFSLLVFTGLLMFGTKIIFYIIFFYIFPPIRLTRYPMQFSPFFLLVLYYFAGCGIDLVVSKYKNIKRRTKYLKLGFFSKKLLYGILLVLVFFCATFMSDLKVSIKYQIYFYLMCMFYFLLFIRSMIAGRFGMLIMTVFILTDLFVFNHFYRGLMLCNRKVVSFPTQAQVPKLPERRIWEIQTWSHIPRYNSLVFRKYSINRNVFIGQSSFFELYNFHTIIQFPVENSKIISGIDEPIIKFYRKALPYRDEYMNQFFLDKKNDELLREVLFLHDTTIKEELLYKGEIIKDHLEDPFDYKIISYTPNDINMKTYSKNAGFLYFSDGYDKYWNAQINSKPTTVYRANVNFKAVLLPPGTNTIRFFYRPTYHLISLWLYFITLSAITIYIFGYLIIRPRVSKRKHCPVT